METAEGEEEEAEGRDEEETGESAEGETEPEADAEGETDGEPEADGGCDPRDCGITCFDPAVCGTCGNGTCEAGETPDACPADCCDPAFCDPAAGDPYPDGDPTCAGAEDGSRCDDGDLANGIETCRGGHCLHEPPGCRCETPGGAFHESLPDPDSYELPPMPADPEWAGTPPSEPAFADAWALRRIDLSRAWTRTRGAPDVFVAIVDTGCDATVADLVGKVVAQYDAIDGDDVAQDDAGHGTALASIVAAEDDGTGIVGVAPGISLICVRVTDEVGQATYESLAAGIRWAVEQLPNVMLIGVGGTNASSVLESAVAEARAAGILVVAPAGSGGGANVDLFPAALPGVVSVAASDRYDFPARGTDLGPDTDLLAPGEQVQAVLPGDEVVARDGSSVAAAIVAGVAALTASADRGLTADQIAALLHATAVPVPHADFARVFAARRVDAAAAVDAADAGRVDVAVDRVAFVAPSGLPAEPAAARAVVENRGAMVADGIVVVAAVDAGDVAVDGGVPGPTASVVLLALPPGESTEVVFWAAAGAGSAALNLEVRATLAGDVRPGNDAGTALLPIGPEPVHRLRLEHARLLPPGEGSSEYLAEADVENAGNVPEPAGELQVALLPDDVVATVAVPPLAAGERARLTAPVTPAPPEGDSPNAEVGLYLAPALGQRDLSSTVGSLRFFNRPGVSAADVAYYDLPGDNLIADAPWRTVRDRIPLLFFFAKVAWINYALSIHSVTSHLLVLKSVRVRNPGSPMTDAGAIVYQDDVLGAPSSPGVPELLDVMLVMNEDGVPVPSKDVLDLPTPFAGSHRILWIPTASLHPSDSGAPMLDERATGILLEVEFAYWDRWIVLDLERRTRRMLGVETGMPLPVLDSGRGDRYMDAHNHTIAEWYSGTRILGPAKAFGGPLVMVRAVAWSLGFIDDVVDWSDWSSTWDQIITTDHNTFFDDHDGPLAGPSAFGLWRGSVTSTTGSPEMDLYRDVIVGTTAGEEVSVEAGDWRIDRFRVGLHALLYYAGRHVAGVWGQPAAFPGGGCLPNYQNLLRGMAGFEADGCLPQHCVPAPCSPRLGEVGGYLFAAHPLLSWFEWTDEMLRRAASLPTCVMPCSFPSTREYVRRDGGDPREGEFVFRGYQMWNGRKTQALHEFPNGRRDLNPFPGALPSPGIASWVPWSTPSGGCQPERADGLAKYLELVRDGLVLAFTEDGVPFKQFMRKVFLLAGSDAHGDFNYTTDHACTALARVTERTAEVNDSAWGRPRTYVIGGTDGPSRSRSLNNLLRGRSIITDGPVIEAEIDAEPRGQWSREAGYIAWYDSTASLESWLTEPLPATEPARFNADGTIGGGGRYEGEGTALVPAIQDGFGGDADTQVVMIRTRCLNLPEFGDDTPGTLELLLTGRASTTEPWMTVPLESRSCDGNWFVQRVSFPAGPLDRSVAVVVHAQFGSGCADRYDAYTNPIWLAPVTGYFPVELESGSGGTSFGLRMWVGGSDPQPVSLYFPVSMKVEDVAARLMRVTSDGALQPLRGGYHDDGSLQPLRYPDGAGVGWFDSTDGITAATRLRLVIPDATPIRGDLAPGDDPDAQHFVLIVERVPLPPAEDDHRLRDAFDNPLGVLMLRVKPRRCLRQTCTFGFAWCKSSCTCVEATRCPPGTGPCGSCPCCPEGTCSGGECPAGCWSEEDRFSLNCPEG